MRSREWSDTLYDIAERQLGYFTASQAREAGVRQVRLVQLHQSGDIERVSRGVYRLMRFPLSPLGQYMEAALWPQVRRPGALAVISHVSALALHALSEVSPAKIHITLQPDLRVRRAVPRQMVVHFAPLSSGDIQVVEGVPVTTPVRTIRDVHAAQLGAALVRRAIADGRRTGRLTHDEADRLAHELLDEPLPRKRPSQIATRNASQQRRRAKTKRGAKNR